MSRVELHHGSATDVGLVRELNEDAFLVAPPVFVVADGMGGHDSGDVASRIVVEEFARLGQGEGARDGFDNVTATRAVERTFDACQARLERLAARSPDGAARGAAGTTAVVAVLITRAGEPRWLLAHLGDSRAYRYHDGVLDQLSTDHSVVQELVDAGVITPEAAAVHPERHVVTRALGAGGTPDPDFLSVPVAEAERLLLCTDGVSGLVPDAAMARIMATTPDPRDAADALVAAAVRSGGHDNATAVVVDVVGWAPDRPYDSVAQRESLEQKLGALP